ncbi:EamA family transporter RarD [Arthrobacter sp. VKM Ac-2550]|uniref:EamA family transporter RarD n=1 Tax=Crystallibacter permensis TaxID=1938888 RepID=UPI002225DCD4|nr:EamA family transporter RarD [Arthrobacter sp. VKM Ac-2550]MCW2130861.1 chloramphenicol-sensitive protein RarD [Arthrobacter sp. VKM Ac-2550]
MHEAENDRRYGLAAAVTTYAIWGFFPVYFVLLLGGVDPLEILVHRVLWGSVVLVGVITAARQWGSIKEVIRNSRARNGLALASLLMGVVWFFYGYGALTGRAVDVALGYFVCPLVTMVLAVAVEGEKLRPAQWVSAVIGAFAIVIVTVGYGSFPWISCIIAVAFALYSLAKSRVSRGVKATAGLTVESIFLVPAAGAIMAWLYATDRAAFAVEGLGSTELWLVLSGPLTAFPLLLFAIAAARLPLSLVGNLQYLNPALQFVAGVLVLQEEMPLTRLLGFGLVWLALAVLVIDASQARTRRVRQFVR